MEVDDDPEPLVLEHEPRPAAAELITGRSDELLTESPLASEGGFDRLGDRPACLAAATRAHALPEECMVPRLRRRVEERFVLLSAGAHHFLELGGFERRALDQRARLRHIGGVMVSMVRSQRAPGEMRLEGFERVGQWRQCDAHGVLRIQMTLSLVLHAIFYKR